MSPGFAGQRTGHQAVRGSSCAPAAAARSVPATCTSHLVPSPQENHDAREASPRSSPSTDPTHPSPRLGFSCPGEAGRMAQAVLWCRGSIPLRTCMEQGRGAGISMDQGVPGHWRGEMRKGRSSASHRGTPPPHSCHHLHSTCYTHAAGTTKDMLSTSPCVQGRLTWARPWGRSPSQGHFSARRAANLALGGQLVPVAQAQPGAHCECT